MPKRKEKPKKNPLETRHEDERKDLFYGIATVAEEELFLPGELLVYLCGGMERDARLS